jgi:hypothetical protein
MSCAACIDHRAGCNDQDRLANQVGTDLHDGSCHLGEPNAEPGPTEDGHKRAMPHEQRSLGVTRSDQLATSEEVGGVRRQSDRSERSAPPRAAIPIRGTAACRLTWPIHPRR